MSPTGMAGPDITVLKDRFGGDIVIPSESTYKQAISRWAANAERSAKFVTFPKDANGVSEVIKWAVEHNIEIAVRGGGHSTSGASSVTDGLVVDLSRYLGGVRVDPEKKLAYIGGGAVWETVDKAAIQHGLATVGGTVNHTGVGGLLLGGGYGFLSAEFGLVIDNLVEATIVVADGRILKVSAEDHPDLFWAIRGGGGNFGIATEFVLKLHPQRQTVFGGLAIFPGPMVERVFAALGQWWSAGPSKKEGVLGFIASPPPEFVPMIVLVVFYNGSENEGRENFKFLFDLGPVADTCKEIPYELLNTLQNPMVPPGRNVYMSGAAHLAANSETTALKAYQKICELNTSPELGFVSLLEYAPLDVVNSVAPDATAFASRGPQSNIMLACFWDGPVPENNERVLEGIASLKKSLMEDQNVTHNTNENSGYSNYESQEKAPPSRSKLVFKGNYPRLQQVKAHYDPNRVFSRWFGVEPADV